MRSAPTDAASGMKMTHLEVSWSCLLFSRRTNPSLVIPLRPLWCNEDLLTYVTTNAVDQELTVIWSQFATYVMYNLLSFQQMIAHVLRMHNTIHNSSRRIFFNRCP